MQRRTFLAGTTAATVGLSSFSARLYADTTNSFEVLETKVISQQPTLYHGWPTLTRGGDGTLYVVCSGGRESHVCPFGRVELMRSHDDGETWTFPEVVLDGPIDDRDAGILVTSKGTILITTFTSLAYVPIYERALSSGGWSSEKLARWRAAHTRVDAETRNAALGTWMTRSTDGGVTFSARYDCLVDSPHGPIELSDGRLLYAGKQLWTGEKKIGVCQSTDDGASWQWLADIPTRAPDDPKNYHELHAVEASDGTLIVQIRNHNPTSKYETLQCESSDGGKTWSTPHSIGVWGYPSHLLKLNDGRLLMSYGHRRQPIGNQARLSEDHGQTWSDPLPISTDATSTDLGYPSTIELTNGTLVTLWYERMQNSDKAVLRQAKWKLT